MGEFIEALGERPAAFGIIQYRLEIFQERRSDFLAGAEVLGGDVAGSISFGDDPVQERVFFGAYFAEHEFHEAGEV